MSKKKASKPQEPSDSTEPKQELTDDELAKVAGGVGIVGGLNPPPEPENSAQSPTLADNQAIISPRDPASGLPTGKRMHKPFTIT